jgi:hypothetical protein
MEDKIKALEAKLSIAIKALEDIENWNDDLEDEWEDQGNRAIQALEKIAILDGF